MKIVEKLMTQKYAKSVLTRQAADIIMQMRHFAKEHRDMLLDDDEKIKSIEFSENATTLTVITNKNEYCYKMKGK